MVVRRNEHIEQRHQILYRRRLRQIEFFRLLAGDAARQQSVVQPAQALASARQHHHLLGPQTPCPHLGGDPVGRLLGFARRVGVFQLHARGDEAVAPLGFVSFALAIAIATVVATAAGWPPGFARYLGQHQHRARLGAFGAVGAVVRLPQRAVFASVHRGQHGAVERLHHTHRTAARVVATEQHARQTIDHKALRGLEHLRLGAAKAVDRLLGVAHQKHAGCLARPCTGVG